MPDRNWKEYNEALVRRGEILLDMEFLDNWSKELNIMNRGKEGARFIHSSIHSVIQNGRRDMDGLRWIAY